ncbi:unnamed protein product [Adineta steineri]|uniref:Uncharacterized protein n=1 Tax=Adineta steineri TaxID=433720 RepID=A0A819QAS0_9BILA|nr:unnamed protein product [Adineta steineri]
MSKDFVSSVSEATSKLEDYKRQWNYMYMDLNTNMKCVMDKLNHMSNSAVISPIRSNGQEQEWCECKQGVVEPIYEFIIRLRALWIEHTCGLSMKQS